MRNDIYLILQKIKYNKDIFSTTKELPLHWSLKIKIVMRNYITQAADTFLTSRPYGIRLDFKRKGFVIFNHHMNLLGNGTPGCIDSLPLEIFTLEDIPQTGERIVKNGDIMDIFFYDETSNPYTGYGVDLEKLKTYNKYIYPLALALNRTL